MMTPDLQTSFTLVDEQISGTMDYRTFADADRHFIIKNNGLAEEVLKLAMREAAVLRIDVGSENTHNVVEFYAFDLQGDKHLLDEIGQIVYLEWIDALHDAIRSSVISKGDFLSDALTTPLDVVSDLTDMRRFVINAASKKKLKRKLGKLLFHHMAYNDKLGSV